MKNLNKRILNNMNIGVAVQRESDGKVIDYNEKALEFLGVTANQLLGKDSFDECWESVKEDGSPFNGDEHPPMIALRTKKPVNNVIMGVYHPREDKKVWILIDSMPEKTDDGWVAVTTFKDITEAREEDEVKKVYNEVIYKDYIISKTDSKGKITFVNEKFEEISGYKEEEILGKDHRILNSGEHSKSFFKEMWETIKSGNLWEGVIHNKNKNGESYWVHSFIAPRKNPIGEIVEYISFRYDVTHNILKEKELQEERDNKLKEFSKIISSTPSCLKVITREGELLDMNSQGLSLIEANSLSEVYKANVYDIVEDSHRKNFKEFNEKICNGESGTLIFEIIGLKGTRRWMETFAAPYKLNNGETGHIAITNEITERIQKEKDLESLKYDLISQADYLNNIRNNANYSIISTNTEGIITSFNKKAEEMLGYTESELVGKETPALFHDLNEVVKRSKEFSNKFNEEIPPGFKVFVCHSDRGLENEFEWIYENKDGSQIPVSLSITSLKDSTGKTTGYIGIAKDLTEIKKMEEELEKQRKNYIHQSKLASIGQMAAGVGHEINNPLAILKGNLSLIRNKDKEGLYDDRISKSLDSVNRIANIVNGLRSFARKDGEETELFDLSKVVIESADLVKEVYSLEGIEIVYPQMDNELIVKGNVGKIQQVVMNLLSNAKDAMKNRNEKKIILNFELKGENIVFSVKDTGEGIPDNVKDSILEPFFTTKGVNDGTGLGLSLVNSFVEEFGGKLSFTTKIGEGTKFNVSLPLSNEDVKTIDLVEKEECKEEIPKKKILVTDDEEGIRELLELQLLDYNAEVILAENGREALELYDESIDIVLSDMQMPKMGGIELLSELRNKKDFKGKFYFITGGINIDENDIRDDFDGVLPKPFEDEMIKDILK